MGSVAHQTAANTQQLVANAQQLEEITRMLRLQFANTRPEIGENSNTGAGSVVRERVERPRPKEVPVTGMDDDLEDQRRGRDNRNHDN